MRARRSLVALDPVDRPEALYQLALALLEAGDAAAARREVLHALEIAPRFQVREDNLSQAVRQRGGGRRRQADHPGAHGGHARVLIVIGAIRSPQ